MAHLALPTIEYPSPSQVIACELNRLSALWSQADIARTTPIRFSNRLSASLGRANLQSGTITLSTSLMNDRLLLEQALCHELAHVVAYSQVGRSEPAHGPFWRQLMRSAGYEASVRLSTGLCGTTSTDRLPNTVRYRHSCAICSFSRFSNRQMPAWRCADCVAAGLDGKLVIDAAKVNQ